MSYAYTERKKQGSARPGAVPGIGAKETAYPNSERLAPLSAASAVPAAGPIQAKCGKKLSPAEQEKADADKTAERMMSIQMAQRENMDVSVDDLDFLATNTNNYKSSVMKALMDKQLTAGETIMSDTWGSFRRNDRNATDISTQEGLIENAGGYNRFRMDAAGELIQSMLNSPGLSKKDRADYDKMRDRMDWGRGRSQDSQDDPLIDNMYGMIRRRGNRGDRELESHKDGQDKKGTSCIRTLHWEDGPRSGMRIEGRIFPSFIKRCANSTIIRIKRNLRNKTLSYGLSLRGTEENGGIPL